MHKIIGFITHDFLTNDKNPEGYILLQLLRSYLILDMYASLEVHTTETLKKGEDALKHYAKIMQVGKISQQIYLLGFAYKHETGIYKSN